METKNNSEFISKVDAFSEEMKGLIENSDRNQAVIIIASEPDENKTGSRQTGAAFGNEEELVLALSGFIKHPQMLNLLKKAAKLAALSSILELGEKSGTMANQKEQEETV